MSKSLNDIKYNGNEFSNVAKDLKDVGVSDDIIDSFRKYVDNTNEADLSLSGFQKHAASANKQYQKAAKDYAKNGTLSGLDNSEFFDLVKNEAVLNKLRQHNNIDDFSNSLDGLTDDSKKLFQAFKDVGESTDYMDVAMGRADIQVDSLGGSFKNMAKSAGKFLLSSGLSMGADILIGQALNFAAKKWDEYSNRQENAINSANELIAEHDEKAQTLKSTASTIEASGQRFVELQKGVDVVTGKNKSLTASEYAEYTTLANSLAESLPGISNGYNELGNAKVKAVGSVSALTGELEKQQQVLNKETIENAHKYVNAFNAKNNHEATVGGADEAGYIQQAKTLKKILDAKDDLNQLYTLSNLNNQATRGMGKIEAPTDTEKLLTSMDYNALKQISKEVGVNNAFGFFGGVKWDVIEKNLDKYQDYLDNLPDLQNADFNEYGKPLIDAFTGNSSNYKHLSDATKEILSSYTNAMDYAKDGEQFFTDGNLDSDKIASWANQMTSDLRKSGVQEALTDLFSLDAGAMTFPEYQKKVDDLTDVVSSKVRGMTKEGLEDLSGYSSAVEQMEADYNNAFNAIGEDAKRLTTDQLSALNVLMSESPDIAIKSYQDAINAIEKVKHEQEITTVALQSSLQTAITNQANLNTALQKAVSPTGLASDDVSSLRDVFADVAGYNTKELLEKTASGIRINRDALAAYQAEQEKLTKNKFADAIREQNDELGKQYDILKDAKRNGNEDEIKAAQINYDAVKQQLEQTQLMAAEYNGLTSDYAKWMEVLSNGEEGAIYDNVAASYQNLKQTMKDGWIGTDEAKRGTDYFWSGELDNASPQEVKSIYDTLSPLMDRWYPVDKDGNLEAATGMKNFLADAERIPEILGKDAVTSVEDLGNGMKKITLDAKEFADAFGISEEVITDIGSKLEDKGYDVEITGVTETFEQNLSDAEAGAQKLKRMSGDTYEWDFDTTSIEKANEQLEKARELVSDPKFHNKDGSFNYEETGATESADVFKGAVRAQQEAQKPAVMDVDSSSAVEGYQEVIKSMQEFQNAKDELDYQTELKKAGLDNNAEEQMQVAKTALENLKQVAEESDIPLDINTDGIQEAEDSIAKITDEDLEQKVGVDTSGAESDIDGIKDSVEGEEAQITVKLDEASLKTLVEGITGEPFEVPVEPKETNGSGESSNKKGISDTSVELGAKNLTSASDTIKNNFEQSQESANAFSSTLQNAAQNSQSLSKSTAQVGSDMKELASNKDSVSLMDKIKDGASAVGDAFKNAFVGREVSVATLDEPLENASEQIDSLNSKTLEPKQLTVDSSEAESSVSDIEGQEVEVPVTVKMDEGQFSSLYEGLTGKPMPMEVHPEIAEGSSPELTELTSSAPIQKQVEVTTTGENSLLNELTTKDTEKTVTVNEQKGTEVTTEEPSPITQVVNQEKGEEVTTEEPQPLTQVVNQEKGTDVTTEQPEPINVEAKVNDVDDSAIQSVAPIIDVQANVTDITGLDGQTVDVDAKATVSEINVEGQTVDVNATATVNEINAEGQNVNVDATANVTQITGSEGHTETIDVTGNLTDITGNKTHTVQVTGELTNITGTVTYDSGEAPPPPQVDDVNAKINYLLGTVTPPPVVNDINAHINYTTTQDGGGTAPDLSGTANYTLGDSPTSVPDAQGIANFILGTSPTTVPPASGVANFSLGSYPTSLPSITQTVIANKIGFASGTMNSISPSHAYGTAYNVINYKNAYADGKVSLSHDENALVNELGTESIIRDGKWMLLPKGMHIQSLKKGDIVLNAQQTSDLLRSGKASGTGKAYANGTAPNAKVISSAYADGSKDVKSKWEDFVDWIERYTARIEYYKDKYTDKSDLSDTLGEQNKYLDKALTKNASLIKAYSNGAKKYMDAAKSVGLDKATAKKVRNGTLKIEEVKDEGLRQKIKDYEEMYDAARKYNEQVRQMKKDEKEYIQQKLDNILDAYESSQSRFTTTVDIIDKRIEYNDLLGTSLKYNGNRKALLESKGSNIQKTINSIERERKKYKAEMNGELAKNSGKKSKAYYDAQAQYNKLTEALYENKIALEENRQQIIENTRTMQQWQIDKGERGLDKLDRATNIKEAQHRYRTTDSSLQEQRTDYRAKIDTANYTILKYQNLIDSRKQDMAKVSVSSEKYQEWAKEVAEMEEAQSQLFINMEKWADEMRNLDWAPFKNELKQEEDMIKNIEHIRDLLNKDNFVAIDGTLTDDGAANLLLIAEGMEANKQIVANYKVAIEKINEELENGRISEEQYTQELDEYTQGIYDATNANEEYKKSILDMYRSQLEAENDLLQDNIDKRKEALKAKEDYYKWDRNVKKQNKDINALRAQIAALEGTTNQAGRARLAQLKEQLSEKQKDLDEDITDRQFDKISDGLSKLSKDADTILEDSLDALKRNAKYQEAVVQGMLSNVVSMYDGAYGKVNNILETTGTILDKTLGNAISNLDKVTLTIERALQATIEASKVTTSINTEKDETVTSGKGGTQDVLDNMTSPDSKNDALDDGINNVVSIKVSPSNVNIKMFESKQLSYTITAEDGSNKPTVSDVIWSSSNTSVATVTQKGKVTGVKSGTATITCRAADKNYQFKEGTCTVKVTMKTTDILNSNKGQANKGTSLLNKWMGGLGYGQLSADEAATISKEYGLNYKAEDIFNASGSQAKQQAIIDKLKNRMIGRVLKELPDENRDAKEVKTMSDLTQHVSKQYKKRLTKDGAVKLATALQVSVNSGGYDKWTSANKAAVYNALKKYDDKISFAKGGYVGKDNLLPIKMLLNPELRETIRAGGDSGIVGINPGELIMNPTQANTLLNDFIPSVKLFNDNLTNLPNGVTNSMINNTDNSNVTYHYDSLITVNGSIDKDVYPGLKKVIEESYKYTTKNFRRDMGKL